MAYRIADYLSDDAKREAVNRRYLRFNPGGFHQPPRTEDGFCPLGVALCAMGAPSADPDPASHIITERLRELGSTEAPSRIRNDALTFIEDWDNGTITDLADALGVRP